MSSEVLAPMVFVDLETTGGVAAIDRITEIGIVEIDAQGRHHVWSSLVNPEVPIPAFIQGLTGITDDMVADAPTFSELADEVWARLEGRLFVAHNARFDHGFLRQAFEREGRAFKPQVLCTVKLSRRMFPEQRRHSLDALVERHGLPRPARHRALADAQALAHYWQVLQSQFDPQTMHDAVAELTGRSQWPSHLPMDMLQALPEGHGVYVLYAQDGQALHVGKGRNVRQQVLRHFQSDRRAAAGKGHGHLVQRVEGHAASGEWGAALLEAAFIARLQPSHRSGREAVREPACTWLLAPDTATLSLAAADALTWAADEHAYGLFGSRREAMKQLREIAQDAQLCLVTLGVEDRRGLRGCEAHGRMLCSGACLGHEEAAGHFARAERVLSAWRLPAWPHAGAIALQEGDVWHVVDRWRYLGAFSDMVLDTGKDTAACRDVEGAVFCRQTFKLVSAWLAQPNVLLRQLERVS